MFSWRMIPGGGSFLVSGSTNLIRCRGTGGQCGSNSRRFPWLFLLGVYTMWNRSGSTCERGESCQVIEVDRRVIGTVKGLTFFEMSFIKFNDNVD